MLVRISPFLRFAVIVDTEGSGGSEAAEVAETVAEAVTEAVEATAEAVAEAVADSSPSLDHERRITELEGKLTALEEKVWQADMHASVAESVAVEALAEAEGALDAEDIAELVEEASTPPVVEVEVEDETDEPPAGVGKSIIYEDWKGLKRRLFGSND